MADVFAYLEGFGTGGGEGGTLKVNAPPLVAVTITNKAGKTKTKTANADGMAIFKGLASGKWNVTIVNSDGKPTTITADVQTEYTVTIAFFSATINITYPAGSTCTCTDGVTTLTAPDTSGTWVCIVPNAGAWTVSSTNGTESDSQIVSIATDGQTASVELSYQIVFVNGSGQAAKTPAVKKFGKYNSELTFTQNSDRYTVSVQANDGNYGGYSTAYFTVDLAKYSTIKLVINATQAGGREYFLTVWKTLGSNYEDNKVAQVTIPSGSKTTVTLDVSSLTGNHVVGLSPHIVNTAICDVYSWIIS